jgi:hypothetical protein
LGKQRYATMLHLRRSKWGNQEMKSTAITKGSSNVFTDLGFSPAGWQNKNLQLVLHVKVIAGAPSSPRVVAAHFW